MLSQSRHATSLSAGVELRGVSSARTTGGTRLTIRRPAGVIRDDVLVAGIGVRLASARAIKPPAGWHAMRSNTSGRRGAALTHVVYYKVASAREPSVYRWRFPARRAAAGGLLAYRGLEGNRLLAGSSGRVRRNTRVVSAPSVRPRARDTLIVGFFSASGRARLTSPRGMARRLQVLAVRRSGVTSAMADLPVVTGATGTRSARSSTVHRSAIGQLVALRTTSVAPQPPPGPPIGGGSALPPALAQSTGSTSRRPAPTRIPGR